MALRSAFVSKLHWSNALPIAIASLVSLQACGYYHHATALRPVDDQGASMTVADDNSVTFIQDRLEVKLRPLTKEELNRQFASDSQSGPKSTNPYTFGDTKFWEGAEERDRFTVFQLSVKNYAYPKVRIDPAKIVLRATNKREYWSLNLQQLDTYYRAYAIGYRGNEYARYQSRMDLLRRTMFKHEDVFSGQEIDGFVVFETPHPDVNSIEVTVQDCVLRFDYRNEPIETVDINYQFVRKIGKKFADGQIEWETASR